MRTQIAEDEPQKIAPHDNWSDRDQPEILAEADRNRELLAEPFMSSFSITAEEQKEVRKLDQQYQDLSEQISKYSPDESKRFYMDQRDAFGAGKLDRAETREEVNARFRTQRHALKRERRKLSEESAKLLGAILERAAEVYTEAIKAAEEQERELFEKWNASRPQTGLVPTLRQRAQLLLERAERVSRGSEGGRPSSLLPGVLELKPTAKKRQGKTDTT